MRVLHLLHDHVVIQVDKSKRNRNRDEQQVPKRQHVIVVARRCNALRAVALVVGQITVPILGRFGVILRAVFAVLCRYLLAAAGVVTLQLGAAAVNHTTSGGACFAAGAGLSPEVEAAVDLVLYGALAIVL